MRKIISQIREIAHQRGIKAYLVGGALRDQLLHLANSQDLDFVVTEGSARELAQAISQKLNLPPPVLFPRFGTAQIAFPGGKLEIVEARKESYPESSRKPIVERTSLIEDLQRRDFTINTLIQDLETGEIIDLLGIAKEDIKRKIIRTPLDPEITFRDDPLRMLRAVRFAAKLDFQIEPQTAQAIKENAFLLRKKVSAERIKTELDLMISLPAPSKSFLLLDSLGLLSFIIPELSRTKEIPQNKVFTDNLFSHSLMALDRLASESQDISERYAALLHDIGKVKTMREKEGALVFYGHEEEGEKMAEEILKELRFSNEEIKKITFLIREHMAPTQYSPEWSDAAVKRLIRRLGDNLKSVLRLAKADIYGLENLEANFWHLIDHIERVSAEGIERINSPLSGEEIMDLLNLQPGPKVGQIKEELVEAIIEGTIEGTKDAAKEYLIRRYSGGL